VPVAAEDAATVLVRHDEQQVSRLHWRISKLG
jgi:hypothetical protein